jgi:hypothetical protein
MIDMIRIIMCLFLFNYAYSIQNVERFKIDVFLDINYEGEKLLYDKPGGKIIYELKHNTNEVDFIGFTILNKNDSMFYVSVQHAIDGELLMKGWIKKDEHICVYSRAYNNPLKLYDLPQNTSEVSCVIEEYNPDSYIVIDCEGQWLKVKTVFKGIEYSGWMSPEMQCSNVYSTCS